MKKIFFVFCLSLTIYSQFSFAGGYQVNALGQKQLGMAHTGTGLLLDGSSVAFNPGAVSFLDSLRMVQVGGSFIFARGEYLEAYPGIYTARIVNHVGTPFTLFAVYKFKKSQKFNLSLGIYTPFGSRDQWPDDWKGNALIREINMKVIFYQPTLSYKISDKIGIGAGLVFAQGSVTLRQGIPAQDSLGNYGEANLKGAANSFGFNAGIYFKPNQKFSIGLDHRSSVNLKMSNGTAVFTVPKSLSSYFPSTTFSSSVKLPSTTTIGFGFIPNEKLKLAFDVNFIGWGVYDTLSFDFAQNTDKLKDVHSARMYKNTFIARFGAQYQLNEKFFVRCGAYFDKSPVQAGYLTPETPDANRIAFTAGASWNITKKFSLDASLLFIDGMKRTDTNLETQFSGTYKAIAVMPGIAVQYLF